VKNRLQFIMRVYELDLTDLLVFETRMRLEHLVWQTEPARLRWCITKPAVLELEYPAHLSDDDVRARIDKIFARWDKPSEPKPEALNAPQENPQLNALIAQHVEAQTHEQTTSVYCTCCNKTHVVYFDEKPCAEGAWLDAKPIVLRP
jgi:hypothetical protein